MPVSTPATIFDDDEDDYFCCDITKFANGFGMKKIL